MMKDYRLSDADRRRFLTRAGYTTGALALTTMFGGLTMRAARAQVEGGLGDLVASPFGAPVPIPDLDTGLPLLRLPPAFRYVSLGWVGDTIGDGSQTTPAAHDGGAVVNVQGSVVTYIRNHETTTGMTHANSGTTFFDASPLGNGASTGNFAVADALAGNSSGGCSRIFFDLRSRRATKIEPAIGATANNCAGGFNPFGAGVGGSWITCEENFGPNGTTHGFAFQVPATGSATGIPIATFGRMEHEAVAVDPTTGAVLITEDNAPTHSGIYLFVPNNVADVVAAGGYVNADGSLVAGRLFMLAVAGQANAQMVNRQAGERFTIESVEIPLGTEQLQASGPPISGSALAGVLAAANFTTPFLSATGTGLVDPRNIPGTPAFVPGTASRTRTSSSSSPYLAGFIQGGAIFARPEGAWYDNANGAFVFLDTNGGPDVGGSSSTNAGIVFAYKPNPGAPQNGVLDVIYAGSSRVASNGPDNLTIHPTTGTVFLCEDGSNAVQRLLVITPSGDTFIFAENNITLTQEQVSRTVDMNGVKRNPAFISSGLAGAATASTPISFTGAEWAGASFSPDGNTLFINVQGPGWTFVITGPFNQVLSQL